MAGNSEHTFNETPDVLALLDKELQSCVMPSISDPSKASSDDLIRDLYRVLAGNGGPTRGLIYKAAATNVNVKLLRVENVKQAKKQDELSDLVAAQKQRCDDVQEAKKIAAQVAEAEHTTIKRIGMALRENKAVIAVILVGAAIMVHNRLNVANATQDRTDNAQKIEQAINHVLDVKLEQLQLIPHATTNRVAINKPK